MISIKLYSPTRNLSKYIAGLYKGFVLNGVNPSVWIANEKPAFDLFAEEKFDVLFIEEENLSGNRALIKCLNKYKNVVLVIKLPDNNLADLDLPLKLANQIRSISANENLNKQSEVVLNHDCTQLVRYGIDIDIYTSENHSEQTDGFVYIGKPTKYINSILSKICNPVGTVNIKLFTPYDCADTFPFSQYCGRLKSINEEKNIYSRADYAIDIAEPGQNYIGERIYEMLACGVEIITNNKLVSNIAKLDELTPVIKSEGFNLPDFHVIQIPTDDIFSLSYKDRAKQILDLL